MLESAATGSFFTGSFLTSAARVDFGAAPGNGPQLNVEGAAAGVDVVEVDAGAGGSPVDLFSCTGLACSLVVVAPPRRALPAADGAGVGVMPGELGESGSWNGGSVHFSPLEDEVGSAPHENDDIPG